MSRPAGYTDHDQFHYQALAVFNSLDANSDGYLNRAEFEAALQAFRVAGQLATPQSQQLPFNPQIDALFDSMDRDRDGRLNVQEFDELMKLLGEFQRIPQIRPYAPYAPAVPFLSNLEKPKAPEAQNAWFPLGVSPRDADDAELVMRDFIYDLGIFILFIITLVPMWVAGGLLTEPSYMHFSHHHHVWITVLVFLSIAVFALCKFLPDVGAAFLIFYRSVVSCNGECLPLCVQDRSAWRSFASKSSVDGLQIPGMPRMKLEVIIVFLIAAFLLFFWSIIPAIASALSALPGIGPIFLLLAAPFQGVFGVVLGAMWPVFLASLTVFSPAVIGGGSVAAGVCVACYSTYFFYGLTMWAFHQQRANPELRSTSSLGCVWATYMLALGLLLLIFAPNMKHEALGVGENIRAQCYGEATNLVHMGSQAMQALRQTPACIDMRSAELCPGFQHSKLSQYLKDMESKYQCRGFCYEPTTAGVLFAGENGTLMSTEGALFDEAVSLFSNEHSRVSCDGAASRVMAENVAGAAMQIQYAGQLFIFVALGVLFFRYSARILVADSLDDAAEDRDKEHAARKEAEGESSDED